jgi:hypothetical protein
MIFSIGLTLLAEAVATKVVTNAMVFMVAQPALTED